MSLLAISKDKVKVGDHAPNFTLSSQAGKNVELAQFLGKKPVVLYFYPKDETPGCTTEACTFRDQSEAFKAAGAEVIGISSDSIASHQQFATKYSLPFTLLSDGEGKVRALYGVPSTFGLMPGRVTYVIDRAGIVRYIFSSQWRAAAHVSEALQELQKINAATSHE